MRRYMNVWSGVLFGLIAIGLVSSIMSNPLLSLLLIAIIAGAYLLNKYPPAWLRRKPAIKPSKSTLAKQRANARTHASRTARPSRASSPFRVIEGGKDDGDVPKYH